MPIDLSCELDLAYFEHYLYAVVCQIPLGKDTWYCTAADVLSMYNAGGEL